MRKVDIRSKCRVNSNREMDTFVGLRCNDGDISINFPLGYHISEDDFQLTQNEKSQKFLSKVMLLMK